MANSIMNEREHADRMAKLEIKFPYQFAGNHIGIDVEPGWLRLFEKLCADVDQLVKQAPPPPVKFYWVQVKEKWGTLRTYYKSQATRVDIIIPGQGVQMLKIQTDTAPKPDVWQAIEDLVSGAETASATICLFCGAPGSLRKLRWWRTTCDAHIDTHWDDVWPRSE